jgi:glutamine amidotransferase PdxT
MQLSNIIVTLLAATAVAAKGGMFRSKGNSTEPLTDRQQCRQLDQMQHLVELAANTTRLDHKTHSNSTKIAAIQAKASQAAEAIAELQANATLMSTCAGIFAMEDTMDDCQRIARVEKQAALAANETALAEKFKGNQTRADEFKTKVADKQTELATLQANTTLTAICATAQTMGECAKMAKLQKQVDTAANDTLLADKFGTNEAKIEKVKAKAANAQAKLDAMQANSTLTSICGSVASGELALVELGGSWRIGELTRRLDAGSTAGKAAADNGGSGSDDAGSAAIRSIEGASGLIMAAFAGVMAIMLAL